jgi:hypothetical protein
MREMPAVVQANGPVGMGTPALGHDIRLSMRTLVMLGRESEGDLGMPVIKNPPPIICFKGIQLGDHNPLMFNYGLRGFATSPVAHSMSRDHSASTHVPL